MAVSVSSRAPMHYRDPFDYPTAPAPAAIATSDSSSSDVIDLSNDIECTDFVGSGGTGQVYKGRLVLEDISPKISVKIIHIPPVKDESKKTKRYKRMKRELEIWSGINHENVLPLLGVARINGDANIPAFICPWMENGNALDFCAKNPSAPVGRILYDTIKGLHYLHTFNPEIIHGDVKAANVLINDRGVACLCDFGLSRFAVDDTLWMMTAIYASSTLRWMAPELLQGDECVPTKASDIYAFGMTCYEILSGIIPFQSTSNDAAVMFKVIKGQRPERVQSRHSDELWNLITRCWAQKPEARPSTREVLDMLRAIIGRSSPSRSSSLDENTKASPPSAKLNKNKYAQAHTPTKMSSQQPRKQSVVRLSWDESDAYAPQDGFPAIPSPRQTPPQAQPASRKGTNIKNEDWDEMFLTILQTRDAGKLRALLARADPELILPLHGISLLCQPTILTLAHRMSAAVAELEPNDDQFKVSVRWLKRSITLLRPEDKLITEFVPRIIPSVQRFLNIARQRIVNLPFAPDTVDATKTLNECQKTLMQKIAA